MNMFFSIASVTMTGNLMKTASIWVETSTVWWPQMIPILSY